MVLETPHDGVIRVISPLMAEWFLGQKGLGYHVSGDFSLFQAEKLWMWNH
jgi:ABC-type nitrate/sulfonate/bicarbonate transport system permease component